MNAIRLAPFLAGVRDKPIARKLTVDEAKKLVRGWLREIEAETWKATSTTNAPPEVVEQLERAITVLRASFSGVLTSITTPRQPHGAAEWDGRGADPRSFGNQGRGGGWGIPFIRNDNPPPPAPPERDHGGLVTSETLYQQLMGACEAIDALLDLTKPPPPIREPLPWADDSDLLKELHSLFTALATRNGDSALQRLELLESRLRTRDGIDVVLAGPDTAHLFKIYPNADPDDQSYVTIGPAMRVRGQLWRQGEARGPARGGDTDGHDA